MKRLNALSVSSSAYSPFPKGEISSDIQHMPFFIQYPVLLLFSHDVWNISKTTKSQG